MACFIKLAYYSDIPYVYLAMSLSEISLDYVLILIRYVRNDLERRIRPLICVIHYMSVPQDILLIVGADNLILGSTLENRT